MMLINIMLASDTIKAFGATKGTIRSARQTTSSRQRSGGRVAAAAGRRTAGRGLVPAATEVKGVDFAGANAICAQTLITSARPRKPDGRTNRISSRIAKAMASLKSEEM